MIIAIFAICSSMKPIILHIGDRVHHKTLGDGVVIAVNEDYCTARFGEKEANFRIPEAFVRGFLTSEDAKIGAEEGTDNPVMEMLPEKKELPKKKTGVGCAIAIFIFISAIIFLSVSLFFLSLYRSYGGEQNLWAAFVFACCFIASIPLIVWVTKRTQQQSEDDNAYYSKTRLDPATELMAGMMGAEMIHRAAERKRQEADKQRYDSLYWQESIRDKNPRHDFDYDHEDDWLGTD